MASSLDLQVVLTTITQDLVDELDAAFARIWLLGPADLCAYCYKAADCMNRARCLHLVGGSASDQLTGVNEVLHASEDLSGLVTREAVLIDGVEDELDHERSGFH